MCLAFRDHLLRGSIFTVICLVYVFPAPVSFTVSMPGSTVAAERPPPPPPLGPPAAAPPAVPAPPAPVAAPAAPVAEALPALAPPERAGRSPLGVGLRSHTQRCIPGDADKDSGAGRQNAGMFSVSGFIAGARSSLEYRRIISPAGSNISTVTGPD